jgi:predicted nucleotidyltransferase component of viral defense system
MHILTDLQVQALNILSKESTIVQEFYWTGGTVLAEFYLQHRLSEDIDLFSIKEVQVEPLRVLIQTLAQKLRAQRVEYDNYLGLHTFFIVKDEHKLKIDFNYYPFEKIGERNKFLDIEYDSFDDIIANKMQTIGTKPRSRDFIDLYFASKYQPLELKSMMKLTQLKFDWYISPLQYSSGFSKAFDFVDEPMLVKPLDKEDYRTFFEGILSDLRGLVLY